MAAMRDSKGCFRKSGEVKRREIVAKNTKKKSNKLLEMRESRQEIHDPNSDFKRRRRQIVKLDVSAK